MRNLCRQCYTSFNPSENSICQPIEQYSVYVWTEHTSREPLGEWCIFEPPEIRPIVLTDAL